MGETAKASRKDKAMRHIGDITKISGYDIPIVDVITGGSPCQDLSVAGNRAGLAGERSSLFLEQIRIVKEMRERDRRDNRRTGFMVRPRYMVWENVPGAFSSNKGKDFQAVLTEIVRIADKDAADVPMPEKGKWNKSGCLYDELGRWSVAWRIHDAQFWGVPQRRKRIALIADFGGLSAPEILFERKGLSRDIEPCEQEGEETSATVGKCSDGASYTLKVRGGVERDCYGKRAGKGALIQTEKSGTLGVTQDQTLFADTCSCVGNGQLMQAKLSDKVGALNCMHDQQAVLTVSQERKHSMSIDEKMGQTYIGEEVGNTLAQRDYKQPQAVVTVSQDAYDEYNDTDKSASIKESGGNYGGGSETLVIKSAVYAQETSKE